MPRTAYQRINPAAPRAIKPVLVDDPKINRAAACGVSRSTIPRWEPWQRYHLTLGNHRSSGCTLQDVANGRVARSKKAGVKVLGFEKDEPATILQAARQTNNTVA
jgi:hypothetical protein